MKNINIILTGAGAPGIQGTIYSLRNNYDNRRINIIGTDVSDFVVGKYLCDKFYQISSAKNTENYLHDILKICEKEKVDVILPQNTAELPILSTNIELFNDKGIKVAVSKADAIKTANNKYKLFEKAKKLNIQIAESYLVTNFNNLKSKATQLGWPNEKIVVKPPVSNGSRGVRIVSEDYNRKEAFYNEKPSSLNTTLNELHSVLGDEFPELIVMEYLPGDEYTVDVFRDKNYLISIPRKRINIRSGITFAASLEKNEKLINHSNALAKAINLNYCFGFQYKISKYGKPLLLESNPRIQGTMIMSTLANANIIYSSVKSLLDEKIPIFDIQWKTKLLRYWGAIGINNYGITKI